MGAAFSLLEGILFARAVGSCDFFHMSQRCHPSSISELRNVRNGSGGGATAVEEQWRSNGRLKDHREAGRIAAALGRGAIHFFTLNPH